MPSTTVVHQNHDGAIAKTHLGVRQFLDNEAVAVATGGQHSLVLKNDGTVWGMGDGSFGQLGGIGSATLPVQVILN